MFRLQGSRETGKIEESSGARKEVVETSQRARSEEKELMHRRPHKLDAVSTAAAHFASEYSYVSRRVHPGTDHQCEYLSGLEDVGKRRREVFERDEYRCVDCGERVTWDRGHMAHGGNTKIERCDCPENLRTKCWKCHMIREHGREPRFGGTFA